MATIPSPPRSHETNAEIDYPTGDGRPVAETPLHFRNLSTAVQTLERYFEHDPMVYTWGNMFVYYEQGNRRKHVSPDVFVALGVPKDTPREAYFTWKEGHGLDFVVEFTSKSTKEEDLDHKFSIYRDTIEVAEYFLFDPQAEYLDPPLQGFRLQDGQYVPIDMVANRLPSDVLGLQLERDGEWLRFYSPTTGRWLPTPAELQDELGARLERAEARLERAEAQRERAQTQRERAEAQLERAEVERQRAEAQLERAELERQRERLAYEGAELERQRAQTERELERSARQRIEADRERLAADLRNSDQELERLRRELERWRRRHGDGPPQPPGTSE